MLVPLTDSSNPYTAMMLQLIANDRRYPESKYPRRAERRGRPASIRAHLRRSPTRPDRRGAGRRRRARRRRHRPDLGRRGDDDHRISRRSSPARRLGAGRDLVPSSAAAPVSLGLLAQLLFLGAVWGAAFLFLRVASPEVGPSGRPRSGSRSGRASWRCSPGDGRGRRPHRPPRVRPRRGRLLRGPVHPDRRRNADAAFRTRRRPERVDSDLHGAPRRRLARPADLDPARRGLASVWPRSPPVGWSPLEPARRRSSRCAALGGRDELRLRGHVRPAPSAAHRRRRARDGPARGRGALLLLPVPLRPALRAVRPSARWSPSWRSGRCRRRFRGRSTCGSCRRRRRRSRAPSRSSFPRSRSSGARSSSVSRSGSGSSSGSGS